MSDKNKPISIFVKLAIGASLLIIVGVAVVFGALQLSNTNDKTDHKAKTEYTKLTVTKASIKDLGKHTNETVSVSGDIRFDGKNYYAVSREKDSVGIRLNFENSGLNPKDYVVEYGNQTYSSEPPRTIVGKLLVDPKTHLRYIEVKSL